MKCVSCVLVHGIVLQEQWIWPIQTDAQGLKKKQCSLGDLPGM